MPTLNPELNLANPLAHLQVEDIENLIQEARALSIQLQEIGTDRDAEILTVTRKYAPGLEQLTGKLAAKELLVTTWCERNRQTQFGKAKSRQFTFGSVQFRVGGLKLLMLPALDWTERKVLDALRQEKRTRKFIRTEESLNKLAILEAYKARKVTDAELGALGLKAIQEETCSLKLNLP